MVLKKVLSDEVFTLDVHVGLKNTVRQFLIQTSLSVPVSSPYKLATSATLIPFLRIFKVTIKV